MTAWPAALAVIVLLASGCYHYRSTPFRQLATREFVHVIADSGFVLQAEHFNGSESADTCRLTRAEGNVRQVVADTVWLAPIAYALPEPGEATLCRHVGGGFFTRDAGVDLRVHASRIEGRRTRRTILWMTVWTLVGSLLFIDSKSHVAS
jgi:hypothetical protein